VRTAVDVEMLRRYMALRAAVGKENWGDLDEEDVAPLLRPRESDSTMSTKADVASMLEGTGDGRGAFLTKQVPKTRTFGEPKPLDEKAAASVSTRVTIDEMREDESNEENQEVESYARSDVAVSLGQEETFIEGVADAIRYVEEESDEEEFERKPSYFTSSAEEDVYDSADESELHYVSQLNAMIEAAFANDDGTEGENRQNHSRFPLSAVAPGTFFVAAEVSMPDRLSVGSNDHILGLQSDDAINAARKDTKSKVDEKAFMSELFESDADNAVELRPQLSMGKGKAAVEDVLVLAGTTAIARDGSEFQKDHSDSGFPGTFGREDDIVVGAAGTDEHFEIGESEDVELSAASAFIPGSPLHFGAAGYTQHSLATPDVEAREVEDSDWPTFFIEAPNLQEFEVDFSSAGESDDALDDGDIRVLREGCDWDAVSCLDDLE